MSKESEKQLRDLLGIEERYIDKWFWAKGYKYEWYNLIVHVYGEMPFLKIKAIDLGVKETYGFIDLDSISEIGSEIINPDRKEYEDLEQNNRSGSSNSSS